MTANPRKCHLYLKFKYIKGNSLCKTSIASSLSEKLLGITFDSELKFEEHINKICNIVNKNLNCLHRTGSHMSLDKRKMILKGLH